MSDILERLRAPFAVTDRDAQEAVAEILRLRVEIARLRRVAERAYYEGWQNSATKNYSREDITKDWQKSEARKAISEDKA